MENQRSHGWSTSSSSMFTCEGGSTLSHKRRGQVELLCAYNKNGAG